MTGEIEKAEAPGRKKAVREGGLGVEVPLGSWWWLRVDKKDHATQDGKTERLVCVVELGTNYAKVETPNGDTWRLHLDDLFPDVCRPCREHRAAIDHELAAVQAEVSRLMGLIQEEVARIGMDHQAHDADSTGTALATLSSSADPDAYKRALVKSKEKTLPGLFEKIEKEHERLAIWMKADLLPVQAMTEKAKEVISEIDGRIFNVEIYAGLSEVAKEVRKGEPAAATEKLRVFQAMAYMDEECLADYAAGGMDFQKVGQFDRWISKKENLERILPFPRCIVAMRVRRWTKDRGGEESYAGALGAFIKFEHEQFDEKTFLYVRNGERLYRIDSQLEFGHLIFPSRDEFSAEPMVFNVRNSEFRTVREHEKIVEEAAENKRLHDAWVKANPYHRWKRKRFYAWRRARAEARAAVRGKFEEVKHVEHKEVPGTRKRVGKSGWTWDTERVETIVQESLELRLHLEQARDTFHQSSWDYDKENPYHNEFERHERVFDHWETFDKSSVHYDEALKVLTDRAKHWNRVALVIQGLFDRSECLHPHPPVQSWTPEGFARAIELIYDGEGVLHAGDPPSFEAYCAKLNASLGTGSWTIGQRRAWLDREQEKERRRRENDPRLRRSEASVGRWWEPSGDDGPGYLDQVSAWRPNKRRAIYRWTRERRRSKFSRWERRHGYAEDESPTLPASITVDEGGLFNASAYEPGDYLQFFRDPRTRRDYVRWAPYLLTAEDWRAGKLDPKRLRAKIDVDVEDDGSVADDLDVVEEED